MDALNFVPYIPFVWACHTRETSFQYSFLGRINREGVSGAWYGYISLER